MNARAAIEGFDFPCLHDGSRAVAKACGTQRTPHAFVFDSDRRLVYQGTIDDHREGEAVTERYVRDAVDAVLAGGEYPIDAVPPMGCPTRWKATT